MPSGSETGRGLRVGIDVTPLLGNRTGIGVATDQILSALARRAEFDLLGYAVSVRGLKGLDGAVGERASTGQRPMPARPLMAAWARSGHPRLERFVGPLDVAHGTNFVVPPTRQAARVVSVWDLTFVRYPELCQPATLRFGRLVERAVRTGATVHTASAAIAEEVRSQFGARREQVAVVPLGIPDLGTPDLDTATSIIEPSVPYILSVGTAEPRKDLPTLVAAFDALAATHRDVELVLVGAPGWGEADLVAAIEQAKHPERIRRTGFVSDAAVAGLLRGARALAYPSRYEGFGFPPLQAMAAGIPVVTTRAGSLPEVVGGAALLVNPGEVEDLAEALDVAVFDEAQRTVLIAAGRARAADFSWERTGEGLSTLYRQLAASR